MYGSANNPSDDTSQSGGVVDKTYRVGLNQLQAVSTLTVVSDGADQRTIIITGRDSTGLTRSETLTLNNTTPVVGAQNWYRVTRISLNSSDGARTVTVSASIGTALVCSIPFNEIGCYTLFRNAASGSAAVSRYEKVFQVNTNPSLTLDQAAITLVADPSSRITMALDTDVNLSTVSINRLTAPQNLIFSGVGSIQSVPGNALTSGSGIGVWLKLALQAGDSPQKAVFTTQVSGTSI